MSDHPPHPPSPASIDKPTVFISDPSVEAERITQALRAAEFHVVDVPLTMLVARVAVQRPRVVILDADAEGALDAVARMRELPDAEAIDVLFCGRAGAAFSSAEDALAHEGSGFFPRPVAVATLVKKIESLALGEIEDLPPPEVSSKAISQPPVVFERAARTSSRPPPSLAPSLAPSSAPASTRSPQSRPPISSRPPPSRPPSRPPPSLSQRSPQSMVSRELAELLSRAEEVAADQSLPPDAPVPSPEEEIQQVLPEEVLAALDAPIDGDDEEEIAEGPARVTTSGGGRAATTGVREQAARQSVAPSAPVDPLTNDGSALAHQTQGEIVASLTEGAAIARTNEGTFEAQNALTTPPRRPSSIPPPTHLQPPMSAPHTSVASALSTTLGSELLVQQGGMIGAPPLAPFGEPQQSSQARSSAPMPLSPAPSTYEEQPRLSPRDAPREPARELDVSARAGSVPQTQGPYALGPGDAPVALARAIASRATGALTFEAGNDVRRVVLREGDIVTAASGLDSESLLAFLGARGDLPRERVEALAGRLPPYGRHAGAALVAQGALGQEQLWPVLRAHAEYLIGQALLVGSGTALLEDEPPGRLKTEPSVFGGAPGAEIFVEVVRRVVASDEALRRSGGPSAIIGEGARAELLRECGLGAAEIDIVHTARGQRLESLVVANPDRDIASILYALWLLGVVDMVRSVLERPGRETKGPDVIDEDAVRDRIRARVQLVDEGDYFALLGVPHNATAYEVKRAYLDLRRAFEPSRVLTPALLDLAEDVRRITIVLEEAYEILAENARRERYRRAIDASPD